MSTSQELLSAVQASPHGTSDACVDGSDRAEVSPYTRFFDAIDQLEDNRVLFGSASLEARIARAKVNRLRELVTEAWLNRQVA